MQNDGKHLLSLSERNMLFLQGAKDVESFDDKSITVDTDKGLLIIKGEGLHIKSLNLEEGKLEIIGLINAVIYNDGKGKTARKSGQGILQRLLK